MDIEYFQKIEKASYIDLDDLFIKNLTDLLITRKKAAIGMLHTSKESDKYKLLEMTFNYCENQVKQLLCLH